MSTKSDPQLSLLSKLFWIKEQKSMRASSVEIFCLKPNCLGLSKPVLDRKRIKRVFTAFSKTLEIVGKSEIGR